MLPSLDSCNSQPGWWRMNVWSSIQLPNRVNVVHVATDVAGKTHSTDDECGLFKTQVWRECHSEEVCRTRSINNSSTVHQPRPAFGEFTEACLLPVHNSSDLSGFNVRRFAEIQWPMSCMQRSNTSLDVAICEIRSEHGADCRRRKHITSHHVWLPCPKDRPCTLKT